MIDYNRWHNDIFYAKKNYKFLNTDKKYPCLKIFFTNFQRVNEQNHNNAT